MQRKPFLGLPIPGQAGNPSLGKVRDIYDLGSIIVAVTTDSISAFDVILPIQVKNKGVVLNMIAVDMMKATEDIIPNCLLDVPNPRVAIWRKCTPFKIEMVVRAYMEGSMWKNQYSNGERNLWGYELPEGIKYQQKLPEVMVTPSTKAEIGVHDEAITKEDIIARNLATEEEYDYLYDTSLRLFARGQKIAASRGLILVDTKYEFGKDDDGKIYLIDEVHTPDSSRYYYKEGYEENFNNGKTQKQLSKEFVRQWLVGNGFEGKEGQAMPSFDEKFINEIESNYEHLYSLLTGKTISLMEKHDAQNTEIIWGSINTSINTVRAKLEGPKVGIIMGSESDLEIMQKATKILLEARVPFELTILSAHRTPKDTEKYATTAHTKGIKVIIAGAGGAAHLAGVIAGSTILPVIGVPIKSSNSMMGLDSLLSTCQMPPGVPVATMAVDGSENASIFTLQILATSEPAIAEYLLKFKNELIKKVIKMRENVAKMYYFGTNI